MKNTFKQSIRREIVDVAFSLFSSFFFFFLYWFGFDTLIGNRAGASPDSSYFLALYFVGWCLIFSLSANIIIQTIFNIIKSKIKTKSYVFCLVSMIDVVFLLYIGIGRWGTLVCLILVLKFIIAFSYYYVQVRCAILPNNRVCKSDGYTEHN